jgi:hypothetical protein
LLALVISRTDAVAYNVYYGQLHSHSTLSDGSGNPNTAYQYARDTADLDFFSLADHCSWPYGANDGLTVAEYQTMQDIANSYNDDGAYVTFWLWRLTCTMMPGWRLLARVWRLIIRLILTKIVLQTSDILL